MDDKYSGEGCIFDCKGNIEFVGNFKNGLRHGIGAEALLGEKYVESEWCEGERVKKKNSSGSYRIEGDKENIFAPDKRKKPEHHKSSKSSNCLHLSNTKSTESSKHFFPIIKYEDGYYDGESVDGKRQGHGILYNNHGGVVYDGMWLNDKKHGKGRLYNGNGKLQYEGFFKEGYRDGKGTEFFESGKTEESVWTKGVKK